MTVTSNVVVVTVAGTTAPPQTVDVTFTTMAGAVVTVGGKSGTADSSGKITFTLSEDTAYTATGSATVEVSTSPTCFELYKGSVTFTTGTSAETVDLPLVPVERICT